MKPSVPPNPPRARRPDERREPAPADPIRPVSLDESDSAGTAARVGERVRRAALGLTAALVTARAYATSEPNMDHGAGAGLYWVLALFVVAAVAIAAGFIGGRFRFRWSWADAAVIALVILVAASSTHALDRRPAINLAWEWIALGVAYLLLRNLPRTREESSVLAGAMVATAFAVSVYGLYQVGVELPALRERFARNPAPILATQGIAPNTPAAAQFADRLMGSNEPWSTFALANSLAGYIVGPLVLALAVWWFNLIDQDLARPRWSALLRAAPVTAILFVCLLLTKSRSAWIGFGVGVGIVVWSSRRLASRRLLVVAGVSAAGLVALAVGLGFATGRLDRLVLTQSSMSMRYRWEYWQGTWRTITGGAHGLLSAWNAPVFQSGVGPGNFRSAYLRYKLPESSEEILDPHDLFLEVWATAGIWALLALVLALILSVRDLFGAAVASRAEMASSSDRRRPTPVGQATDADDRDIAPPRRMRWLIASAGAGWIVVVLLGMMNLFESDLYPRWLILGGSWLAAVLLGGPLWRRLPIPALGLGAALIAVLVNLLAAGGIGIPTVALGLWATLAIGLNLRDDRPCGRLREYDSRIPPFVLLTIWAGMVGLFAGDVVPYWRAEAAIADAQDAMSRQPPDFKRAQNAYERNRGRPILCAALARLCRDGLPRLGLGGSPTDRFPLEDGAGPAGERGQRAAQPDRLGLALASRRGHPPAPEARRVRHAADRADPLQRRGRQGDPDRHPVLPVESDAPRPAGRGQRRDLDVRRRRERGGGSPAPRRSPHKAPRQEAPGRGTRTPRGHAGRMEREG